MRKPFFALLFILLFLAACDVPPIPSAPAVVTGTPTIPASPTALPSQTTPTISPTAASVSMPAWIAPAMPTAGEILFLESLDMIDANIGWSIDSLGRIFHTADRGGTWVLASPPDGAYTSQGFFALDGTTAWAAKDIPVRCWDYWGIYQCDQPYYAAVNSGLVWKTTDGGQTWQPSQPFPLNVENAPYSFDGALPFSPVGLQFTDPTTGWLLAAVGQTPAGEQSLLYQTNDGGATWEMIQAFGFETNDYSCPKRGFAFSDENNGWLIANCPWDEEESRPFPMLLRTRDGGRTWSSDPQIQEIPLPSAGPDDYLFFEPALGEEAFQRYPDGSLGVHLIHYFPREDRTLTFFRLGNPVVSYWVAGVKFYQSPAEPRGWTTMGSEFFLDAGQGWRLYWDMATDGRWLQKTVDGGQTWESTKAVSWLSARFEFVDAQTGWALVTGQAGQTTLVQTTDGGQTWSLLTARAEGAEALTDSQPSVPPSQNAYLMNIAEFWMLDPLAGWAVTQDDQLLRTTDGGLTWMNVTPPAEYKASEHQCFAEIIVTYGGLKPEGFFALDADRAWVAQYGCAPTSLAVWKTSDGGRSWRKIPLTVIPTSEFADTPPFLKPISVSFSDAAHGWLAAHLYAGTRSYMGYLFETRDGGESWQPVSDDPLDCYPYCVDAIFRAPERILIVDDPRLSPAPSDFLDFDYSTNGGKTWEEKMLFAGQPPLPANTRYSSRVIPPVWGGFYCGTTRLEKFPGGVIGANSECYDFQFVIDYLTLIDENDSFTTTIDGIAMPAEVGRFHEFGGWMTDESEFFYNEQLGWRLYIGRNADANGPEYVQATQDGGNTWKTLTPVPWQDAHFQFLDPQNGWALVTLPWGNALVKTTDGGSTWEELNPVLAP